MRPFLFWLWPPCEAKVANDYISKKTERVAADVRWEKIVKGAKEDLPEGTTYAELFSIAKELREAEWKRKEIIENKATTFVCGVGLSCTIISIIVALFVSRSDVLRFPIIIAMIAYFASFIFLLISAYYAIKVRQVEAFHSLSADRVHSILKENQQNQLRVYIVEAIADCKINEAPLLRKSNYLSVAEELFLRGLALLAFASVISVLYKFT